MDTAKKWNIVFSRMRAKPETSACKHSAFVSCVSVTVDCFEANQQLKHGADPPAPVTVSSTSLQDKAPPAETLLSFVHKQPRAPTGIKNPIRPVVRAACPIRGEDSSVTRRRPLRRLWAPPAPLAAYPAPAGIIILCNCY